MLNLMNASQGAYESSRVPPGAIPDVDRLLGCAPHTFYILLGVKDLSTVADLLSYLAERGLSCAAACSEPYGRGAHRGVCAVLSASEGAPCLQWRGAKLADFSGRTAIEHRFVSPEGNEGSRTGVIVRHVVRGSDSHAWPELSPAQSGGKTRAPLPPVPDEVKIGDKNGNTIIVCVSHDCIDF